MVLKMLESWTDMLKAGQKCVPSLQSSPDAGKEDPRVQEAAPEHSGYHLSL